MADGIAYTPKVHADGVYFDLPLADYLADRALSGSALKKLVANPPDWWWEHGSNPLWDEPQSDARNLGTLVHKLVIEGIDAYQRTYCTEPARADFPDALDTAKECSAWLREKGLKVSGSKDELVARIREADPDVRFWDDVVAQATSGRTIIKPQADRYARLVEKFVRCDPEFSRLLSDGLPELSIFWTEDGLRFKSRIDWLAPHAIVDLKKYGQPPRRGRGLMEHVLGEAVHYGYDLQAVHNWHATAKLPGLSVVSPIASAAHLDALRDVVLKVEASGPPDFFWLFVHCPGSPTGIAPRFRHGTDHWRGVERMRNHAIDQFRQFQERCGDAIWIRSEGVVEIEDTDWPIWAGSIG